MGTSTDIDALKRAEAESRSNTLFAQQLLGIVSHDLKNPLDAVLVGGQLLLRSSGLTKAQARIVARIVSAGERAVRLVGDLLDFARVRLGEGIPVQRRPADFDEAIRRAVDELRLAHPDRVLEFRAGGTVEVHSTAGDGTTFRISLPRGLPAEAGVHPPRRSGPSPAARSGSGGGARSSIHRPVSGCAKPSRSACRR